MNRMLGLCIAAGLATAPMAPLAAQPPGTPGNWTAVSIEDLKQQDAWRRTSPTALAQVRLDMNGDGLQDEATLVVDRARHRSGLRVCLAQKHPGTPADCHIVAEDDDETGYEIMGIEAREPGCHLYNAMNDRPDTDGEICTRTQALDYFRFASASSFFVYDSKTGRFNRYWDSD